MATLPPVSTSPDWESWRRSILTLWRTKLSVPSTLLNYATSFCNCCGAILTGKNYLGTNGYCLGNKGILCGVGWTVEELKESRKAQGLDYPDLKTFEIEVDGVPYSFMWRDTDR